MSDFLDDVKDINYETKAITVRAAVDYLNTHDFWRLFKMEYKDLEGNTTTLLPADADPEVAVFDMMNHMRPTAIYMQNTPSTVQTDTSIEIDFAFTFEDWWIRRAQTYGWLNDMLNRRDYDPLENYDRKEDGGWKDTTDVGARSASDIMGATQETTTDTPTVVTTVKTTPGVTDTITETPAVTETVTETPTVTTTVTETPAVTTTVTETPAVTTTVTETPAVTTTVTETPAVTDTVVETPRVAVQTVSTPGVTTKTSKSVFGDNSSTAVPLEETTVGPIGGGSDTTTVTPTTGTNQTQTSHTGTNQTVTGQVGTNQTVTGQVGTNQTVTGYTGNTQTVTGRTGTNREVTTHSGFDTEETSYTGNNQSVKAAVQHTDQHNSLAAQDVVTRLYQQYRVHGNIGVTAVSDMLSKELGLRKGLDLVKMAINEFLDLYTFYLA